MKAIAIRGNLEPQADMFCLVSPEEFVPPEHPLRAIKPFVDAALQHLSPLGQSTSFGTSPQSASARNACAVLM